MNYLLVVQDFIRTPTGSVFSGRQHLLALLACGVSFPLSFGLSFLVYAICMLVFFGLGRPTVLYSVASVALMGSYFLPKHKRA